MNFIEFSIPCWEVSAQLFRERCNFCNGLLWCHSCWRPLILFRWQLAQIDTMTFCQRHAFSWCFRVSVSLAWFWETEQTLRRWQPSLHKGRTCRLLRPMEKAHSARNCSVTAVSFRKLLRFYSLVIIIELLHLLPTVRFPIKEPAASMTGSSLGLGHLTRLHSLCT